MKKSIIIAFILSGITLGLAITAYIMFATPEPYNVGLYSASSSSKWISVFSVSMLALISGYTLHSHIKVSI